MIRDSIKYLIQSVFSFECLFVLFLFAGKYKNDPRLEWVPIDLTLLFLILSVGSGVFVLHKRGGMFRAPSLRLTGLFSIFLAYAVLSYLWTPSQAYAFEKTGYLAVLTFWPFLACTIIIGYRIERFKRFAVILTVLSLWFCIETFLAFLSSTVTGQQVRALGVSYLAIGRVIGPAALVLLVYGTVITQRTAVQVAAILIFVGAIVSLLLLGGRGPFLATAIPSLLPIYYGVDLRLPDGKIFLQKHVLVIASISTIGFLAVYPFVQTEIFSTIKRFSILLDTLGQSATKRLQMYGKAISIWMENPLLGTGIGGWPVLAGWGDKKMYPHNMILEVLSEFGVVGFVIFMSTFAYALWYFFSGQHIGKNPWKLIILMLFSSKVIISMTSGDLSQNRALFAFLGFLVARTEDESPKSSAKDGLNPTKSNA